MPLLRHARDRRHAARGDARGRRRIGHLHGGQGMSVPDTVAEASNSGAPRILVIGYGNPGREDDGLGPAAAAEIERLGRPGVSVRGNYQLVLEDAADVAEAD